VTAAGAAGHWFELLADHMGPAYLRYSFTKGTEQEVDFLLDALGLGAGSHVVDVGCGPGRHALALARRGVPVTGVDIAARFVTLAAADAAGLPARFVRADARRLPLRNCCADVALSLCQGGFGLLGGPGSELDEDVAVLAELGRVVRPGGAVVVSAFSAYFQVRWLEDGDSFDVARGVNHERTEVRSASGEPLAAELWTTCYTPRELRLMAQIAGLEPEHLWSVTPGSYAVREPELAHAEFLLVARAPR
jgi:SAM-dependent methyltransferase